LQAGRVVYPLSELAVNIPEGWVNMQNDPAIELGLSDVVAAVPEDLLSGAQDMSEEIREVASMKDYFKPDRVEPPEPEPAPAPEPEPEPAPEIALPAESLPQQEEVSAVEEEVQEKAPTAGLPFAETMAFTPEDLALAEMPGKAAAPEEPVTPPEAPEPSAPPPVVEAAPPPEVVTEPEAAEQPVPAPVEKKTVQGWDGVEKMLSAGADLVDINTASEADLIKLTGVGHSRAKLIVRYRTEHGPFASIFDLLNIQGIGRRTFSQMTGLNPRRRINRHEVLNELLDMPDGSRPTLVQIVSAMQVKLRCDGCILSGRDGSVLAANENCLEGADRYAAMTAQLFRRSRRYLSRLAGQPIHMIVLPIAKVPLMFLQFGKFSMTILLSEETDIREAATHASRLATELNWLLGCRAVVRGF